MRLLLLFGAIATVVTVLGFLVTGPLQQTTLGRIDERAVEALLTRRTPRLTDAVQAVDRLAGAWGILVMGATAAALGIAHRGSWRPAVLVLLTVAGEVLLYWLTSSLVGRARPDAEHLHDVLPADASFPSGHVAAAVTAYGSACVLALVYARGRWRWFLAAAAAVVVASTMVARVYLGAHYPADVVGGLLLGAAWLWGVSHLLLTDASALPHHLRWDSAPPPRGPEPPA